MAKPLAKLVIELCNKLSAGQISLLRNALTYDVRSTLEAKNIIRGLAKLVSKYSGDTLFRKVYKRFGGKSKISIKKLIKYAPIFSGTRQPKQRDMLAAEKHIGAKAAELLYKKFNIIHFGRYHPSVLSHLVRMAKDPNHDRHKPLIIAVVATQDHSDVFYWGNGFKYDPRVRLVVAEVSGYTGFKKMMWALRKKYGISDAMMLTSHGSRSQISYANQWGPLRKDFKGYFGDRQGFVLLNACSVGKRPKKNGINFAQAVANGMNAEVRAARSVEGLLSIKVYIDKEGRARLRPVYFELGWPHFGFNFGGSRFYPNKTDTVPESVYNSAADINTGWSPGAGMSIVGQDPVLSLMFGGRYALAHRVRLGLDIAMHYNPLRQSISYTLDPEVFVGFTNHLGFFGGGRFGVTTRMDGRVSPLYQANFGAKIMLPFMNGELDIGGTSVNGENPKFFFGFQGKF